MDTGNEKKGIRLNSKQEDKLSNSSGSSGSSGSLGSSGISGSSRTSGSSGSSGDFINISALKLGKLTLEEIWQIPSMLSRNLKFENEIIEIAEKIHSRGINDIFLIGDGTSYHAGFVSSYIFNKCAGIKTYAEVSPEFGYLHGNIIDKDDLVIGISQSGESEFTLSAVKEANEKGVLTLGITNNAQSTLAKTADFVLELHSGVEKSVMATKTYINTLGVLSRLALEIAKLRGLSKEEYEHYIEDLKGIPKGLEFSLQSIRKQIREIAPYFKFVKNCFVLGSGPDYGAALEASLKLKEGARIFAQAYSTAEFPHGPITLADESSWILALIPPYNNLRRKMILKLLNRVKERNATITGIIATDLADPVLDMGVWVPKTNEFFQPFFDIIPIQLLSVELAIQKGINPDKPKFLSKISKV